MKDIEKDIEYGSKYAEKSEYFWKKIHSKKDYINILAYKLELVKNPFD